MKRNVTIALVMAAALVGSGVWIFASTAADDTKTASMNYAVPHGVKITTEYPITRPAGTPVCDNWPNTPSVLPCYLDIEARATDSLGNTASDFQRWHYVADSLPACESGQVIRNPAECVCKTKVIGNPKRCR